MVVNFTYLLLFLALIYFIDLFLFCFFVVFVLLGGGLDLRMYLIKEKKIKLVFFFKFKINIHRLNYNKRPGNVTILTKMAIKVYESCCLCKRRKKHMSRREYWLSFKIFNVSWRRNPLCCKSYKLKKRVADVRVGIVLLMSEQELSCWCQSKNWVAYVQAGIKNPIWNLRGSVGLGGMNKR